MLIEFLDKLSEKNHLNLWEEFIKIWRKKKEKEINDPDFLTLILSGIGTSIRKYSI